MDTRSPSQPPLPRFEVDLEPPHLAPWRSGNDGVRGFVTIASGVPGPHVAVVALTHGNEIAGAIVLDRLLRSGVSPARGTLTCGFANLAAFDRFDPQAPTASRFIDEDFNRLWDPSNFDSVRHSSELDRAREIRPLIDTVDVLLDLHSMLWPSDPLLLSGSTERGRRLCFGIGNPTLVVADHGHVTGRRLIDYERFCSPRSEAAAVLVEGGQHWQAATVGALEASLTGFLDYLDVVPKAPATSPDPGTGRQRYAEVTMPVTASTSSFAFVEAYRGGDVIPRRNTLIAMDGAQEIRTPHDDCLLVMPSPRPSRGHTAVRLARFVNVDEG